MVFGSGVANPKRIVRGRVRQKERSGYESRSHVFLVMFVCEGLGMMALAMPFIRRRGWAGFRVAATLNDEETWYRVNAYFGKWLFVAGAVFALAAIGLYFTPGVGGSNLVAYSLTCAGILLTAVTVAVVAGFRSVEQSP